MQKSLAAESYEVKKVYSVKPSDCNFGEFVDGCCM